MFSQQWLPVENMIAKSLLTFGIAFLFLVLRRFSRQREVRRLVKILHLFAIQHLNQLLGGRFRFSASVPVPTGTAREMAFIAGSSCHVHQSGQCPSNPTVLHFYA